MRSRRPAPWLLLLIALATLAGASALMVRGGGSPRGPAASRPETARAPGAAAPGPAESGEARTRRAMALLSRRAEPVYRGSERKPLVALTFDDGPGPGTMRILSTLNRLGVPGTFFVIGRQIDGRERELRALVAHGHVVAVHAWNHPDLTTLPRARVRAELLGTRNVLARVTGLAPVLYRPPYGAVDRRVIAAVAGARMVPVLWDADGGDWEEGATAARIARVILAEARPGSIILLHDGGGGRGATARALPRIVAGLRARGLRPVRVTELLERDPPPRQPARPATPAGRSADTPR